MRFDDRLVTVLGQAAETVAARQAVWRQLVDLLAQVLDMSGPERDAALERLRLWRGDMPVGARRNVAASLAGRTLHPELLRFFAEDSPTVSAPLLAGSVLSASAWVILIPQLSPVARALLRHRRDLPPAALRALDVFGPSDLVIESPLEAISESRADVVGPDPVATADPMSSFNYETGADGLIRWSDASPRGAVIGVSIAAVANGSGEGVDGQAAGAFRRRAPFREARLALSRSGPAGGDWSLSGVPCFEPVTGRFTGFRGTARRPRIGERADTGGLLGSSLAGDSFRQLAHEVRTPLNAIIGFAEMIERQVLGPAAAAYRGRAETILSEARRLQVVLDDLDEAARLASASFSAAPREIDWGSMLTSQVAALQPLAAEREVAISLMINQPIALIVCDPASAERMVLRLLSATIGLTASGETLRISMEPGVGARPETWLTIDRPVVIRGRDEQQLLNALDEPDGTAPALGLGFTLRLVRSLAEACGGRFDIGAERLFLKLPAASGAACHAEAASANESSAGRGL